MLNHVKVFPVVTSAIKTILQDFPYPTPSVRWVWPTDIDFNLLEEQAEQMLESELKDLVKCVTDRVDPPTSLVEGRQEFADFLVQVLSGRLLRNFAAPTFADESFDDMIHNLFPKDVN